jgi:hypothetical protein
MALPSYIELPGSSTHRYPFPMRNCVSQTFVLPASYERLKAVTDHWLNAVPGSEYRFVPLLPFVICNPFWIERIGWQPEGQGFMRETDFNFGFFVACFRGELFDHIAFAPAYLVVDNPLTVTTGREVFGYRKVFGQMEYVAGTYEPAAASTWVSKSYAPHEEVELAEVARIVKPPSWGPASSQANWESLVQILTVAAGDVVLAAVTALEQLIALFKSQNLHIVYLLQLRSVEDPTAAAYQALVESPMQITKLNYAWLLPPNFGVKLTDYPSYPLISDLGITVDKDGLATSVLSYQLNFDAVLQPGQVLATSSTGQ